MTLRLVPVVGNLDPAGLAPLSDPHLRLDHARVAHFLRRFHDGGNVVGHAAVGDRHAALGEELLALILEQIQVAGAYPTHAAVSRTRAADGTERQARRQPGMCHLA